MLFKNYRNYFYFLALILLSLIVYSQAIPGGYIMDDDIHLTDNENLLQSWHGLWLIWSQPRIANVQYYPLTYTSFWIEYHFWKLEPYGYHLTNILLHCLSAFLLWHILNRLEIQGAWLIAIFFLLHPIHVESVAWITERKNTLSCFIYLLAMISYLQFYIKRQRSCLFISYFCYILALTAKTVTCSLPVALLAIIWWKQGKIKGKDILSTVPFFIVGVPLALYTASFEKYAMGAIGPYWDLSFLQRLCIASRAWWFYIVKLIWPSSPTFIYPRWEIDIYDFGQWSFLLAALFVVYLLWHLQKKITRGPLGALAIYSATIFPALGFFNIYPMRYSFVADRFCYHASFAILALWGACVYKYKDRLVQHKSLQKWIVITFFLVICVLTYRQSSLYRNELLLWQDTMAKNPNSVIVQNNLGSIYGKRGYPDKAIFHLRRSLELEPTAKSYYNLGIAYANIGQIEQAIFHYKKAIYLKKKYFQAYNNLGNLYLWGKDYQNAITMYQKAIASNVYYRKSYSNLAQVYLSRKQYDQAIAVLKKAITRFPDHHHKFSYQLGFAYYKMKKYSLAIPLLQAIINNQPENQDARLLLGQIYLKTKP